MSKELCPLCAGVGERYRCEPIPFSLECRDVLRTCEACSGTGFEREPTLRQLVDGVIALEAAVRAIDAYFARRTA